MVNELAGSVIAVLGGTGSFGSMMARHALEAGARAVHVFSRDEAKQDDMRRRLDDDRVCFFLGDVRDRDSLWPALQGVDLVFHAAALKQVPSCEFFPQQAVLTNVIGSDNALTVASRSGVKSFVCLSTDKAVYPINVMGETKALMEKITQAFARNNPGSPMTVSMTRYGNVMYSRGSVIPVFVRQLRSGGPLTLTVREMTRFLMSLADSVQLVEYAFIHAQPGDIFVKKAPASTIEILARATAELFGVDNPQIRVIGARHGEKMHETLLSAEEMVKAQDEVGYFRVPLDTRGLQYERYFDQGDLAPTEAYTSANTRQLNVEETKELLLTLPQIQGELELAGLR
ncbi:MAG: polysaccharide biosynthesis protein [Propionibacteriaceae bacterium]|jgi:UDP-glucose 4-epimerase|nr:polysaccharide biosynthesis protein [Propionibacteriaceae bacterium]